MPTSRRSSRLLQSAVGRCVTAIGCGQASLDEFHCHVVSDESAEELEEADEHRLERLFRGGVAVCHDRFRNAVEDALVPGAEPNLRQLGQLGARLCKRAGEKRATAVPTDPLRQLAVEIVACSGGGARGALAAGVFGPVTVDQATRCLSR